MNVTIDKAGRIVLPKKIRDQLRISAGDELELSVSDDAVSLRPKAVTPVLKRVNGWLVFSTGKPIEDPDWTIKAIEKSRNDRMKQILGLE